LYHLVHANWRSRIDKFLNTKWTHAMTITVVAAVVAPLLFAAFVASLLTAILFRP